MTEGHATPELWGSLSAVSPGVPRSYPAKLQSLLSGRYTQQDVRVFNGGLGGRRAEEDLGRMLDLISTLQPEVMILMHGANDLIGGRTATQVAGAIEDLVRAARARGVVVLLSTVTRVNPLGTKQLQYDPIVPVLNAALAAVAATKDATLVDVHPFIPLELLAPDGLHLLEAGNQKLAEIYLEALKRFEIVP